MTLQVTALVSALVLACAQCVAATPTPPRAEVVHWWTSRGESAALKVIATHYRDAGGVWIDTAVTGAEQSRAVAISRIIGGTPPAAAQFNTSKQFLDLIEEDMLENVDDLARSLDWDKTLPEPVRSVIKVHGHYYAVPVSLHMPTSLWYSRAAFKKAGIRKPPGNMTELFTALDKLKAAGLVPLAHGGQAWQKHITFIAVLSNLADRDFYLKILRDKDADAMRSTSFRNVLLTFKRLHGYIDAGTPGRSWHDATGMLLRGEAGVQIMGDWVKGEIVASGLIPGEEIGCISSFSNTGPLVIQGDAFIFPKSGRADVRQAQKMLSSIMAAEKTQRAFSRIKGSVPLSVGDDRSNIDACTREAIALLKDTQRHVGNGETYLTAGQNGAMETVLAAYWDTNMSVEAAQQGIIAALVH
jgi:glucose/mannose transport system substrate-binding protein